MILLLAGTKDGREIAEILSQEGYDFMATAVSEYGISLLEGSKANNLLAKALDERDLIDLIQEKSINIIIDATHPYAKLVSEMVLKVSAQLNIPRLRFERPNTSIAYNQILRVSDYTAAAEIAASFGKRVFLTIGSKNLEAFTEHPQLNLQELVTRVLPDPKVLAECFQLGLRARNIIAMQGPFSSEMNRLMFLESKAQVIVSKDSGVTGGTDTKILAAKELDLPIILINRPKINYGKSVNNVVDLLCQLREIKNSQFMEGN